MHFDDRLATVLRLPEAGDGLARIQFQQLLDLLAELPADATGSTVDAGFARLSALGRSIPASGRARMLQRLARPLRSPRLIEQLAGDEAEVACAAIAVARITEGEWQALVPALPVRARGILRHRRDLPPSVVALLERLGVHDRGLPTGPSSPSSPAATQVVDTGPVEVEPSAHSPSAFDQFDVADSPARPAPDDRPPVTSADEPIADLTYTAPTGDLAVDQDMSADVLELLDLAQSPPAPTSLSDWARARAAKQREQARHDQVQRDEAARVQAARDAAIRDAASHDEAAARDLSDDRAGLDRGTEPATGAGTLDAGIGAIVRRIEEFRRARHVSAGPAGNEAPRLPLGDVDSPLPRMAEVIDFMTDAQARVAWADGPYSAALTGLSLLPDALGETSPEEPALAARVRRRLPLRGEPLALPGAPALAGPWTLDAVPRFDPASAHFTGYAGRLRRPFADPAAADDATVGEGERLREVLHELRTPANAIQVAAEIIQQQLYGPAPHEYRALAAGIAGDCAHILAGFEELDRLAKLETGALALEEGTCDIGPILLQTVERLRAWTEPRNSGFVLPDHSSTSENGAIANGTDDPAGDRTPGASSETPLLVALDQGEAERLIWRLFASLAGAMATEEWLRLTRHETPGRLVIDIPLPAALAHRPPEALFEALPLERGQSLSAGMFGTGFTLRLATAEAAASGGSLRREGDVLRLTLPALSHSGSSLGRLATTGTR